MCPLHPQIFVADLFNTAFVMLIVARGTTRTHAPPRATPPHPAPPRATPRSALFPPVLCAPSLLRLPAVRPHQRIPLGPLADTLPLQRTAAGLHQALVCADEPCFFPSLITSQIITQSYQNHNSIIISQVLVGRRHALPDNGAEIARGARQEGRRVLGREGADAAHARRGGDAGARGRGPEAGGRGDALL